MYEDDEAAAIGELQTDDTPEAIEKNALEEFGPSEVGSYDCRRILKFWFGKLRERAGEDNALYGDSIWDAVTVLWPAAGFSDTRLS